MYTRVCAQVHTYTHTCHPLRAQALDCFMGSFVLDYVEEVCGDPHLTAADPVDASLLDGKMVKEVGCP